MKQLIEEFVSYKPGTQTRFLKSDKFNSLSRQQKIGFLKRILASKTLSSKTIASSLKILRELKYHDRFIYQKFFYHPDVSVSVTARKALSDNYKEIDSGYYISLNKIKQEHRDERVEAIERLLRRKEKPDVELLISFLNENYIRIRELIVDELSHREVLNEKQLVKLIGRSVWFVRSALIEILGNRKSELLMEKIDLIMCDANVEVKLKLIQALAKLDSEKVKRYLERLASDPHIWVRKEAQKVLAQL